MNPDDDLNDFMGTSGLTYTEGGEFSINGISTTAISSGQSYISNTLVNGSITIQKYEDEIKALNDRIELLEDTIKNIVCALLNKREDTFLETDDLVEELRGRLKAEHYAGAAKKIAVEQAKKDILESNV